MFSLGSTDSPIQKEQCVLDIAKAHNADPGAVLLSWGVKSGHSVATKSTKEARIKANFVPVDLTDDEMSSINALDRGGRISSPPWGVTVFVSNPRYCRESLVY
jgi:glycerol 2-dehydrogenase (NADP+)